MYFCNSLSLSVLFLPQIIKAKCVHSNCPACPAVTSLQAASLPGTESAWHSAGRRAAGAQSRIISRLAPPCSVGSARLTEDRLVCVWKLSSCSSGTPKTDLQGETGCCSPSPPRPPFLPRGKTDFPPDSLHPQQGFFTKVAPVPPLKLPEALTWQVTWSFLWAL